jgi:tripartite-type tricarboxylate transporter receptor subunit TctC
MQRRSLITASALLPVVVPLTARAQARTTRIVVPFAAGGPIDVTARILAERVKDTLGNVIIENRAGGGGNIGVDAVAKAAPDGLTLGIATTASHGINPWRSMPTPRSA